MPSTIVGLKELRNNMDTYAKQVAKGKSFIIVKQSKPIFQLTPIVPEEESWETVIDFTKIQKGGVLVEDIVSALAHGRNQKSSRKAFKRI